MEENRTDNVKFILSKLNNLNIDIIDFIGIVNYIIYSKEIFPKNKDIKVFLKSIFEITYLDYVMKSRTLIVSRISKYIFNMDNKEFKSYVSPIIEYMYSVFPDLKDDEGHHGKYPKKKNANDKLDTWLKGL